MIGIGHFLILITVYATFTDTIYGEITDDGVLMENFTTSMMHWFAKNKRVDNWLFSPISVATGMGAFFYGIRGEALDEIKRAMRLPDSSKDAFEILLKLQEQRPARKNPVVNMLLIDEVQLEKVHGKNALQEIPFEKLKDFSTMTGTAPLSTLDYKEHLDDIKWLMVNKILINEKFKLNQEFITDIDLAFQTTVSATDFQKLDFIAKKLNQWISRVSADEIFRIITQTELNENYEFMTLNALFFTGIWQNDFNVLRVNKCFYVRPGKCIKSKMMSTEGVFNYVQSKEMKAKIVEIPYQNSNFSMFILASTSGRTGIEKLMKSLNDYSISSLIKSMVPTEMNFELPPFEMEYSIDAKKMFEDFNVTSMFGDSANLTMMTEDQFKFNKLIYKSKYVITPRGNNPAIKGRIKRRSVRFNANYPFVFFVMKNRAAVILSGLLLDPTKLLRT